MTQHCKLGASAIGLALLLTLVSAPAGAAEIHKLLPDDTAGIVTINVRQVLDSNLVKKHALELIKQGLQDQEEVQKVTKALGLDPLKDIDRVVTAGSDMDNTGLIVVEGRFDPDKIKAQAAETAQKQAEQLKVHKVGGYELYEVQIPDHPDPMFVAVASKNTIVAGATKEYVTEALDKAAG